MEISDNNSKTNGFQPSKPVINHGKPNLAPKPPVLNGKTNTNMQGCAKDQNKIIFSSSNLKKGRNT